MQRCGMVMVLCTAGQICTAAVAMTVQPDEPDPLHPPVSFRSNGPSDRPDSDSAPNAFVVGPTSLVVVPDRTLNTTTPHNASLLQKKHSAVAPDASNRTVLNVHGWLQTNFLLFPDARPREPVDVLSPSAFSVARGKGGHNRFWVSARDSRLTADAQTVTAMGHWRAVAEFDVFGRSARSYDPRVRLAYLAWLQTDGPWGITTGQDWSLFADPSSYAVFYNPLPLGTVFVRQPQVRLTHRGADGLSIATSIERARGDIASAGGAVLSSPIEATPDLVVAARLERPWGALQWGGLVRDGTRDRRAGWGVSTSGNIYLSSMLRPTHLRFQTTYGVGIARYIGEFGSSFEREVIETARIAQIGPGTEYIAAANVSCEHAFTRWLSGSILGSVARAGARHASSFPERTVRSLGGNTVFHPSKRTDLALEYLTMSRRDGSEPAQRRSVVRLSVRVQF